VRKNPFKQLFPTEVDGEKRGYPLTNPVGTKRSDTVGELYVFIFQHFNIWQSARTA
jgi:hypothetical protein